MPRAFRPKYRQLGAYLLVAAIAPISLVSQVARSSLTGTVTDPQGRRIPGAAVHAIENASGLARESVTTADALTCWIVFRLDFTRSRFPKAGFLNTKDFDFSKEDRVDPVAYNRILWQGLKGDAVYPGDASLSETRKRYKGALQKKNFPVADQDGDDD